MRTLTKEHVGEFLKKLINQTFTEDALFDVIGWLEAPTRETPAAKVDLPARVSVNPAWYAEFVRMLDNAPVDYSEETPTKRNPHIFVVQWTIPF